ncbi:unnamed protein product [Prunus brigantina]
MNFNELPIISLLTFLIYFICPSSSSTQARSNYPSSSLCNLLPSLNPSKVPSQPKTPPTHLPILQTQNIFFPSNQKNPNLSSTLYHLHIHKKFNTQITHQLSPPAK